MIDKNVISICNQWLLSLAIGMCILQVSFPSMAKDNNPEKLTLAPSDIEITTGSMLRQEIKLFCSQPSRTNDLLIPSQYRVDQNAVANFIQQAQLCQASPVILKLTLDSNLLSVDQDTIEPVKLKRQIVTKDRIFSTPQDQVLQSTPVTVKIIKEINGTLAQVAPGEIIDFVLQPTPSEMIVGQAHTFRMTYTVAGIDQQNIRPPQFIDHGNVDIAKAVPTITVATDDYNFPTVTFVQDWTLAPKKTGNFHLAFATEEMVIDGKIKQQKIEFGVVVVPNNKFVSPVVNADPNQSITPDTNLITNQQQKLATALRLLVISAILNLGLLIYIFKQPILNILNSISPAGKNPNHKLCIQACKQKNPLMARYYLHRWLADTNNFPNIVSTAQILQKTSNHCNPSAILALDRACFTNASNWDANVLLQWTNDYKLTLDPKLGK